MIYMEVAQEHTTPGLMGNVSGIGGINFGNIFRHRQDTGSWGDFDFSNIMGGYNNG